MKGQALQLNFQKLNSIFIFLGMCLACQLQAQLRVSVTNESNEPLVGVLAFSKDYQHTFVSDEFGHFELSDNLGIDTLNFKYLGYADAKISWKEIFALGGHVQMTSSSEILEEVLFIGRTNTAREDLPYQIEAIDRKNISLTQAQTAVDALHHHANVFVQKSQMGGGSPVIRGFEANKVLLVVDGVRMNNAIYRSGHLQNAITIDQSILDRMEIIYGPNSLLYGSDALGGVVHFRTRKPKFNYDPDHKYFTEGQYSARYSSANKEKSGHLDFNIGGSKIASLTSISYSDYGDLRAGGNRSSEYPDFGKRTQYVESINGEDRLINNDNPNVQVGTGYSQFDLLQKFLIQTGANSELAFNTQFSTSSNVPRYDQLTEVDGDGLEFAEWYYGPQTRWLNSISFNHFGQTKIYNTARFILAQQNIDEDRIDRKFGSENRSNQQEDVNVLSFTADFSKLFKDTQNFVLDYGFDLNYNDLNSTAFDENIRTGSINSNVFSRYPSGGSTMSLFGAYAELDWESSNSVVHLNGGIRYSRSNWEIKYSQTDPFNWPDAFYSGVTSTNDAFTWAVGSIFRLKSDWNIQTLVSTAFRSPNIDDIGKIRVKGHEVSIPNPALTPEYSTNAELSISKKINNLFGNTSSNLKLSLTGFYTDLNDAIVRDFLPLPDGTTFLVDEGDTLYTAANINAGEAYIYGWSFNTNYHFNQNWAWEGSINYLKGRVREELGSDSPLSHIPPVYGKIGSLYSLNDWDFKLLWLFNLKKELSEYGGSEDNLDKATPEGTPAWSTVNFYVSKNILPTFTLNLGFENLFDTHYRPFASGVSAPGFNAIISLSGRF